MKAVQLRLIISKPAGGQANNAFGLHFIVPAWIIVLVQKTSYKSLVLSCLCGCWIIRYICIDEIIFNLVLVAEVISH